MPPDSALAQVVCYWTWNRDRFLPVPEHSPGADRIWAEEASDHTVGGLALPRVSGRWLLAALQAESPVDRAGATLALGCAGDEARAFEPLLQQLVDPSLEVQQAAVLGLGELGGARARFALVRVLACVERSERIRAVAALALGIAACRDGVFPQSELRRAAQASADLPELREAVCAAVVLARCEVVVQEARHWLREPGACNAPGLVVHCAGMGGDWLAAAVSLRPWLLSPAEDLRLAAFAACLQRPEWAADVLARVVLRPDPKSSALGWLVASEWRLYPARMPEAPASLRAVAGLGLALHSGADARLAVAAAEREDHSADWRPVWLLAAGLTGDASAPARALVVQRDVFQTEVARAMALEVEGLLGGDAMVPVRENVMLGATPALRSLAADLCGRRATDADFAALRAALVNTRQPAEIASLLMAMGRSHRPEAGVVLRQHAGNTAMPEVVRRAAWKALALWLRPAGVSPASRLLHGGGHVWLSPWLAEVVQSLR